MKLCAVHLISKHTRKFQPTVLLNLACDWLALDRDISFGRLTQGL